MSAPFEIRNNPTRKILHAIGMFVVAAILGFFALLGLSSDVSGWLKFLLVVLALAALGLGLFDLRSAFDRRAKVVLDSQGFRDRRLGDVLVPWGRVRQVECFFPPAV